MTTIIRIPEGMTREEYFEEGRRRRQAEERDSMRRCKVADMWDAVRSGDLEKCRQAIEAGADIYICGPEHGFHNDDGTGNGNTVLHEAKDPEILELLLKKATSVHSSCPVTNRLGETPLHCAKNAECAALLITYGYKVNEQDGSGKTPLHNVTDPDIARVLIQNGANLTVQDNEGKTPLDRLEEKITASTDPVEVARLERIHNIISSAVERNNNNRTRLRGVTNILLNEGQGQRYNETSINNMEENLRVSQQPER